MSAYHVLQQVVRRTLATQFPGIECEFSPGRRHADGSGDSGGVTITHQGRSTAVLVKIAAFGSIDWKTEGQGWQPLNGLAEHVRSELERGNG